MVTIPACVRTSARLRVTSLGHVFRWRTRARTSYLRVLSHPGKLRGGVTRNGRDGDPVLFTTLARYGHGGRGRAGAQPLRRDSREQRAVTYTLFLLSFFPLRPPSPFLQHPLFIFPLVHSLSEWE